MYKKANYYTPRTRYPVWPPLVSVKKIQTMEVTKMISTLKTDESIEKINWAIDQTAAWMLELTKLKQEIEQGKQERHLLLIR